MRTGSLRLVTAASAAGRDRGPQLPQVDLLEQYEAYLTACGCSPATVAIRSRTISALIGHAGVDDPLELTRQHVVAWLGRPITAWSRVTYWVSVQAFSRWLVEFGHDPASDLTAGIPKPKQPQPVARPIDDATVERLLALKMSPQAHAYVRLALFQALRVHEIAKLRADDFDLTTGWLMVTGKGGVTKPIPIHQEVAKLAAGMPAFGFWFPAPTELGHVQPMAVSTTIRNALGAVGSTATAHQLRDTAATRLQRRVKDIRLTQSMLRHSSIRSTQKYTEVCNDELQRAVGALDWAPPATEPPPAVDLAAMSDDQLRALVGQLAAALDARSEP